MNENKLIEKITNVLRQYANEALWHDIDEEIKNHEPFLYENNDHDFHVGLITLYTDNNGNQLSWNEIIKQLGLIRWIYVKDIV